MHRLDHARRSQSPITTHYAHAQCWFGTVLASDRHMPTQQRSQSLHITCSSSQVRARSAVRKLEADLALVIRWGAGGCSRKKARSRASRRTLEGGPRKSTTEHYSLRRRLVELTRLHHHHGIIMIAPWYTTALLRGREVKDAERRVMCGALSACYLDRQYSVLPRSEARMPSVVATMIFKMSVRCPEAGRGSLAQDELPSEIDGVHRRL
jgi:hypothetical protein